MARCCHETVGRSSLKRARTVRGDTRRCRSEGGQVIEKAASALGDRHPPDGRKISHRERPLRDGSVNDVAAGTSKSASGRRQSVGLAVEGRDRLDALRYSSGRFFLLQATRKAVVLRAVRYMWRGDRSAEDRSNSRSARELFGREERRTWQMRLRLTLKIPFSARGPHRRERNPPVLRAGASDRSDRRELGRDEIRLPRGLRSDFAATGMLFVVGRESKKVTEPCISVARRMRSCGAPGSKESSPNPPDPSPKLALPTARRVRLCLQEATQKRVHPRVPFPLGAGY